jgi:hypothetical protein
MATFNVLKIRSVKIPHHLFIFFKGDEKMKKVTLLSLVLILLAVSVVPVMAAGPNNGNGNGGNAGQGNGNGNQDQTRQQDQDRQQNGGRNANSGVRGTGNLEHTRMRTPFYLQGTITAISGTTVTVTLIHGNAQVKQYIGTTLDLTTNDAPLYYMITPIEEPHADRVPIKFSDLCVGQVVAIHGNLVDTVYTARLITVYNQTTLGQSVTEKP